jgi:hypothetical protein
MTASWLQRWAWWKEFRQLGEDDLRKRVEHSILIQEKIARRSGRPAAVINCGPRHYRDA